MEIVNKKFTLQRDFNASKQRVFDAFATADALARWWGPVEAPIDVIKLDFRPNGIFHYKMKGNQLNYGIFKYLEIDEPNGITWINSFANEKGEIIKPPFEGLDIPKEILNKMTLEERNGMTRLTITAEPLNATENEIQTFYSITEGMKKGFGGTLNQLERYLNEEM